VRYADDFIITGRSQSQLVNEVLPLVEQFLCERDLELSAEKTHVTHIQNGFDFLGQNIRKYGRKLLIMPAQKNVQAALTKIRGIIEKNKSATQENLINQLNPVIRGWADYHRHCVAKRAFARMDLRYGANCCGGAIADIRGRIPYGLLSRHRRTDVEICGTHRHGPAGAAFLETASQCGEYAHTTSPKNQRRSQSF
jgi:hypothetical protein